MVADRKKVEQLLKTARGHIDGILRMIEEDRYCMDIAARYLQNCSAYHSMITHSLNRLGCGNRTIKLTSGLSCKSIAMGQLNNTPF